MPFHAPPAADERAALHGFLIQQHDALRAAVYGLTDEQASRTHPPSTLTLGSLVKHATGVQRSWLNHLLAAPEKYVDPRSPEQEVSDYADEWRFEATDSLAEALSAYDEVCADVLKAVRNLDLETPLPVPDAPWFPQDIAHWSVRWGFFHLIEELARHAGHADIIREGVDGATMYELVAGREGFPATDWLTPWQPPA